MSTIPVTITHNTDKLSLNRLLQGTQQKVHPDLGRHLGAGPDLMVDVLDEDLGAVLFHVHLVLLPSPAQNM